MDTKHRIRNSMLWAAYGDALGFITELCNKSTLSYRTSGVKHVTELIPWKRKIGGMSGVSVDLPQGVFSDDTQLRLAVCRSIREDGVFDVEPFAKVEIPVFLVYSLGAGIGTKTAAESLKKKSVNWNTNFFKNSRSDYLKGGGNGAAMRIQPHIWSAHSGVSDSTILNRIIRDSIVTHGHPVAWVGAAFHGLCLLEALRTRKLPEPIQWQSILERVSLLSDIIEQDDELSFVWLSEWERRAQMSVREQIKSVVDELGKDIKLVDESLKLADNKNPNDIYVRAVEQIGGLDKSCRGSGTKTALLALLLTELFKDAPSNGMIAAVNLLGSDTDTIATMAGALFGLISDEAPPQEVVDQNYLVHEADRMYSISKGSQTVTHAYPKLIKWSPPRNTMDLIAKNEDSLMLRGFGEIQPIGEKIYQKGRNPAIWQFVKTQFDQTLLIKRRPELTEASKDDFPKTKYARLQPVPTATSESSELRLEPIKNTGCSQDLSVEEATDRAIQSKFDPKVTGELLIELSCQKTGVEKAIGFAAIVAKAKQYRLKKKPHGSE